MAFQFIKSNMMHYIAVLQFNSIQVFFGILILCDYTFAKICYNETIAKKECQIFDDSNLHGGAVCGSNGKTYSNKCYLECLNKNTGSDVAISYYNRCRPGEENCKPDYIYHPVCGSDGKTWPNKNMLDCHNIVCKSNVSLVLEYACNKEVDRNEKYTRNPVCGNNAFTYNNIYEVQSVKKTNPKLEVAYAGTCRYQDVFKAFNDTETDVICNYAHNRFEDNSIVDGDGETYSNPMVYLCIKRSENKSVEEGLSKKYVTHQERDDHLEVCGNDGKTYKNREEFNMEAARNKHLNKQHSGPCNGPDDNPCGLALSERYRVPVCASDKKTYVNIYALWCSNRIQCKMACDVRYIHDGMCLF